MTSSTDQDAEASMQRVSHGDGIGYAIILGGRWVGTLAGEEGEAFRARFVALPADRRQEFLRGVALGMSAKPTDQSDRTPPRS